MKKRSWFLWMILLMVACVFIAVGCGGGGGGEDSSGGDVLVDLEKNQAILDAVEQEIFEAHGGGESVEIELSAFVAELKSALLVYDEVESVEVADSEEHVRVKFTSGLEHLISFVDEELYSQIFGGGNLSSGVFGARGEPAYNQLENS
ncbi:MAG: hypothetical protein LBT65_07390, partial [Synergistaceae bacterium]|nr:hypothetical protein [Synergistaceae bacterium]